MFIALCPQCEENLRVESLGDRIEHNDDGSHTFVPDPVRGDNVTRIHSAPSIPNPMQLNPWEAMSDEEIAAGIAGARARIDAAEHTIGSLQRELIRRYPDSDSSGS